MAENTISFVSTSASASLVTSRREDGDTLCLCDCSLHPEIVRYSEYMVCSHRSGVGCGSASVQEVPES